MYKTKFIKTVSILNPKGNYTNLEIHQDAQTSQMIGIQQNLAQDMREKEGNAVIPSIFQDGSHMLLADPEENKIVYTSENGTTYTFKQLVNETRGNVEYAKLLLERLEWQSPETLIDEDLREEEIIEYEGLYLIVENEYWILGGGIAISSEASLSYIEGFTTRGAAMSKLKDLVEAARDKNVRMGYTITDDVNVALNYAKDQMPGANENLFQSILKD